ncbi:MAG: hypothetical protein KC503_38695 [Myxococcales bacterium]|nr:hypothetical protein [Myxococcales bacterium]
MSACGAPIEEDDVNHQQAKLSGHSLDKQLASVLAHNGGIHRFRLPTPASPLSHYPADPKNPITRAKVQLGQLLFHETALGVNNVRPEGRETYSCAACHPVQGAFMANIPQGIAEGGSGFGAVGDGRVLLAAYDSNPDKPDVLAIRTPTIANTAYQQLMLWNGMFGGVGDNLGTEAKWVSGTPLEFNHLGLEGVETQAVAGLGVHRMADIQNSRVAQIKRYQRMFRRAYPADPAPITRLNAAKAIAAYERTVVTDRAPFQRWLRGVRHAMTAQEKRGALLFFGKAGCVSCHSGPALNSLTFHAMGFKDIDGAWDPSRVDLRPFGGTVPADTRRGRGAFTDNPAQDFAFKTPQLYNLRDALFLGHGGSKRSVREVVEYFNAGVSENTFVPTSKLSPLFKPLGLSEAEVDDLVAFVEDGLYDNKLSRYTPKHLPSGNCVGVNDPQARLDKGCK